MTGRTRQLEGKHVLIILLTAFGVISLANLALAVAAVMSFPGMEVRNGYVASQSFEEDRTRQEQLGWKANADYGDRQLMLTITTTAGRPAKLDSLNVTIGRPTHMRSDQVPAFHYDGMRYLAELHLDPGRWNLELDAVSREGIRFRQRLSLRVPREKL